MKKLVCFFILTALVFTGCSTQNQEKVQKLEAKVEDSAKELEEKAAQGAKDAEDTIKKEVGKATENIEKEVSKLIEHKENIQHVAKGGEFSFTKTDLILGVDALLENNQYPKLSAAQSDTEEVELDADAGMSTIETVHYMDGFDISFTEKEDGGLFGIVLIADKTLMDEEATKIYPDLAGLIMIGIDGEAATSYPESLHFTNTKEGKVNTVEGEKGKYTYAIYGDEMLFTATAQ